MGTLASNGTVIIPLAAPCEQPQLVIYLSGEKSVIDCKDYRHVKSVRSVY